MDQRIREILSEKEREGLLRKLTEAEALPGGCVSVVGREYVNFSSNDYLGLSSHPAIARAALEAVSPVFGSGASRLMCGTTAYHRLLEDKVAVFKNKEAALVFNSGYQANVGVISALVGKNDAVFSDRLNHASIIDGIKLSGAALFRFRHNDAAHLAELLKKERKNFKQAIIITETVFSMDGDIAPLDGMIRLKKEHNCLLMVDEAHATGVFGPNGGGIVDKLGHSSDVDILMGTFSKALGSFGAFVAVSRVMREFLINTCRAFIYSTSLPPVVIAANIAALKIVADEPERRTTLLENAAYLREGLKLEGFDVKGESQIIPVVVGGNEDAVKLSGYLKEKGYWALPVRPPTVPENEARIRISLSFAHGRKTLDRLLEDMREARKALGMTNV